MVENNIKYNLQPGLVEFPDHFFKFPYLAAWTAIIGV
jgi:hypothetical protein